MSAHHGEDYDDTFPENPPLWQTAQHAGGESITTSRYPLMYVPDTWDVRSTLELLVPGIDHRQHIADDGTRTVYMLHADVSWALATAARAQGLPAAVHQGGPGGCGTSWTASAPGSLWTATSPFAGPW